MCQILDIKPGASVPMEMLEITCDVNKHGFGVAYAEGGEIKIERSISINDPKILGKLLDDLRDKRRCVHIRHATIGDVTLKNNHPFVVLEQKKKRKKSTALVLMHNGTLWSYDTEKDKGTSDTLLFTDKFVRPLALRCEAYGGLKSILRDEIFRKAVLGEIKSSDRVLLMDNTGYILTFNKSSGKDFEALGFWASNDYSFNKTHNRASSTTWENIHRGVTSGGGFREFDRKWNRGSDSVLHNLPWKEVADVEAEREAWMLEMTGSPSSPALMVPNSLFIDRAGVRKECAAAGAFIHKKTDEHQKARRM